MGRWKQTSEAPKEMAALAVSIVSPIALFMLIDRLAARDGSDTALEVS